MTYREYLQTVDDVLEETAIISDLNRKCTGCNSRPKQAKALNELLDTEVPKEYIWKRMLKILNEVRFIGHRFVRF